MRAEVAQDALLGQWVRVLLLQETCKQENTSIQCPSADTYHDEWTDEQRRTFDGQVQTWIRELKALRGSQTTDPDASNFITPAVRAESLRILLEQIQEGMKSAPHAHA